MLQKCLITTGLTTKEDGRYYYTFLGWSKVQNGSVQENVLDDVEADTTVYAIYSLVEKTFTVRFFNGTELLATYTDVAYGSTIEYPDTPVYNGVGNAEDYAFNGWSILPENITQDMDCYAEYDFVGLYFRQFLTGTMLAYEDTNDLETIASYAFSGEENLISVSMPSLIAVSDHCFAGCSAMTDVSLPKVLATNNSSFYYNSALVTLKLPELTLMNGSSNFNYLNALKELRLPKNTSSLADTPISLCAALELLDLGVITEMGAALSYNLAALTTLILRNESQVVTPYSDTIFNTSSPIAQGTGKILVPRSLVASYKADSSWGAYSDVIYAIEDNADLCS